MIDSLELNQGTVNNFFAPTPGLVAKQIATPDDLAAQSEAKNVRPDNGNALSGLLVQTTLSGSPDELRAQTTQPQLQPLTVEKKVFTNLYYSLSKASKYMQIKLLNFYDSTGTFVQNAIKNPRDTAIRSKQNPGDDLKKLYQAQFQLLVGPQSSNAYVADFANPLPGALTEGQFVQELTPSSAEASAQTWLQRAGIIEVEVPAVAVTVPTNLNQTTTPPVLTPLETVCLQKRI